MNKILNADDLILKKTFGNGKSDITAKTTKEMVSSSKKKKCSTASQAMSQMQQASNDKFSAW